jgi:desumoylating isopeptidase 1
MFLLGKGIPDHIVHMPQAVLDSPFGRMLMPALNQQVNANRQNSGILGIQGTANGATVHSAATKGSLRQAEEGVRMAENLTELNGLLERARNSFAVVFFTSATCAPCKTLYPLYDSLSAEVGDKGVLIKVDTSHAFDVGAQYAISGTPTFITFLKGKQESRWSGADPARLRGDVQLLMQMAWPRHRHENMNLPTFARTNVIPIMYTKLPPLERLLNRMGPVASNPACQETKVFIEARNKDGPAQASLPDVTGFAKFVRDGLESLPAETAFTVIDMLRCALVDPRFSGVMAEEPNHQTILSAISFVNSRSQCPYALRLVTLQMACNLFSSPLYPEQILLNDKLRSAVTQLLSSSFLDDKNNSVRVAAASLLFNVALFNNRRRTAGEEDALPEDDQVELAASTLEAITQEDSSSEAFEGMLLALGYLAYRASLDSQLVDLLRTMEAGQLVMDKQSRFPKLKLVKEVGDVLLGKGLQNQ